MIGVRSAVDANEPVVRVFMARWWWWFLLIWACGVLCLVGAGVLAWTGAVDGEAGPDFWWFCGPFGAGAFVLLAALIVERLDPTPAVEIRAKRITFRSPPAFWAADRTVEVADMTRLWVERDEDGTDRLCVLLRDGREVREGAGCLTAVELERLIREATGLDVPGRPPAAPRSGVVRRLRAAVGADPGGPVAEPPNKA